MLRLGPSQTLQVLLGGAVSATQADVVVCFTDIAPSFPKAFQPQVRLKTTSGATAVDICESPEAATTREIDFISLRNNDTASITVTLRIHDSGGTNYKLIVVTLLTLEQLQFTADSGWVVKDTSGSTKLAVAGAISATSVTVRPSADLGGILVTASQNNIGVRITNSASGAGGTFDIMSTATGSGYGAGRLVIAEAGVGVRIFIEDGGSVGLCASTATPANGSTNARVSLGTTSGFGLYYGSGAPTVSAAKGSFYLRSDGSTTNDRAYINTDGSTTWTALTTAA